MSRSNGPVVIVTGGGTGIGAAVALLLHERGFRVSIGVLEQEDGAQVEHQISAAGGAPLVFAGDLTEAGTRQRLVHGTLKAFHRIDALVNSAAITGAESVAEAIHQPLHHFERIIDVNLTAAFACSQLVANVMRGHGGGSIVNVSSVGGSAAQRMAAAYCASKGALDALTRSLAFEWAAYGIRVNAVAPGDIDTKASEDIVSHRNSLQATDSFERLTPLGRRGSPQEVAHVIGFLVSSEASFMTGEVVRVDGGFLCY